MAAELALRLVSTIPAAAGAWMLAAVCIAVLRIRAPRLRAAVWAWAVADTVLALGEWNSAGLLLARCAVPRDFAARVVGPWAPWAVAAWAAVAVALLVRLVVRSVRAERAAHVLLALHPAEFDERVALPPGDGTPFVAGTLRPVLVVPAEFWARLGVGERAATLAHERAHLGIADRLLRAASSVAGAVLWFDVPLHAVRRGLADAIEACADAAAVRSGARRGDVARALLEAARCPAPVPAGAASLAGSGRLAARMESLRRPVSRAVVAFQVAALLCVAPWRPGAGSAHVRMAPEGERGRVSLGLAWTSGPVMAVIR